jgi:Planctomycete cytochrome C/WD domain, G-beta repeat
MTYKCHSILRLDGRSSHQLGSRLITLAFLWVEMLGFALGASGGEEVSYCKQIAPLLEEHCLACHGAKKSEGGYRVDSYDALITPGESGATPVSSTDTEPQTSELLRRLTSLDISERMPLEQKPLSDQQIQLFEAWIKSGAPFDGKDPKDPLWLTIPAVRTDDLPNRIPHAMPIAAMVFSANGDHILVGDYHALTEWSVADRTLHRKIPNMAERILAMAMSADGKLLAVGGGSPGRRGDVRLVDVDTGNILNIVAQSSDVVFDLAFRPGHPQLAVACADSSIRIIDLETSKVVKVLSSHSDWVTAVAWNDDGSKLASASRDKAAKIFDATSAELLASFHEHEGPVQGIAFLPGGQQLVSVGSDKMLYRWEAAGGRSLLDLELSGEPSKLIRVEGGVLIPCSTGETQFFDIGSNTILTSLPGHTDWVLSATYHAATGRIATGSFDSEVRFWNAADRTLIETWKPQPNP